MSDLSEEQQKNIFENQERSSLTNVDDNLTKTDFLLKIEKSLEDNQPKISCGKTSCDKSQNILTENCSSEKPFFNKTNLTPKIESENLTSTTQIYSGYSTTQPASHLANLASVPEFIPRDRTCQTKERHQPSLRSENFPLLQNQFIPNFTLNSNFGYKMFFFLLVKYLVKFFLLKF